jgi:diaminopimelate epimerase
VTGISVVKGHAYGNDFLLVPEGEVAGRNLPELAKAMCHRFTGIGADGLMVYAHDGDRVRMRLFNADGSASEVSGNGVRCLAALVVRDSPRTSRVTIDTAAGPKILDLVARSGDTLTFRASMGQPEHIRLVDLDAAGERVRAVALSVGNPQCVLLNDPLDPHRFQTLGPALEHHPEFPNRTNVSFVRVEAPDRLRILIWERGVGPTTASGTGACGAAVAAAAHGGAAQDVEVISPGGSQRVEWRREENNQIYLTGWARLVFDGRYVAVSA